MRLLPGVKRMKGIAPATLSPFAQARLSFGANILMFGACQGHPA